MKLALLGDMAFYGKFSMSNPDIKIYLKSIKDILSDCDYVVGNLETPFADKKTRPYGYKSAFIKSDVENIELLKYIGIDAVCLANNHTFDYGQQSYDLTKQILDDNGIEYFGVESKILKKEIEGNKLAFLGYCCYSSNPQGMGICGINEYKYTEVDTALSECDNEGYNSILGVHAGQEHVNYPNVDHIHIARKLSIKHNFVYYGHHPHVLQGIEEYKESLIYYSLGNFCFDDVYTSKSEKPLIKMLDNNKSSMIVILEYEHNKLVRHEEIPFYDCQIVPSWSEQIKKNIDKYSSRFSKVDDEYARVRADLIGQYLSSRKSMRNLKWYFRRLNYSSFRQIMNARRNAELYYKFIKQYCNE